MLMDAIRDAYHRVGARVRTTPVMPLEHSAFGVTCQQLSLKLEHLQVSGTFKARGAFNNLLSRDVPPAGVIAASGGNHGAAVAYAAAALGVGAEIFVPTVASAAKVERLRDYGATVNVVGDEFQDTLQASLARQAQTGAMTIHAYDQIETVAGQGGVGLEWEAQDPDLDTMVVAVGGGGLIAGISGWLQGRVKVVAVETTGTSTLHSARANEGPIDVNISGVGADALGARRLGDIAYAVTSAHVATSVLVDDDAVMAARKALWHEVRLAVEPAGAAALAAVMCGAYQPQPNERVGLLLCGANTQLDNL
ncbi:MAG: threonine/serine dehydratase [Chromatiales bacterium]|nr:threonine/serine dehydratase [Chromatiales bacterium]